MFYTEQANSNIGSNKSFISTNNFEPSLTKERIKRNTCWGPRCEKTDIIKKHYKLNSEIESFLIKNDSITDFLITAISELYESFDEEIELVLNLVDSDLQEQPTLFIEIHTGMNVEDAIESLDNFEDNWFLDYLDYTEGDISLDLVFVEGN